MKRIVHVGGAECSVTEGLVMIEGSVRPRKSLLIRDPALLETIVKDRENEIEFDGLIYGYRHDSGSEIVVHQRRRISAQDRILRHPNPVLRAD